MINYLKTKQPFNGKKVIQLFKVTNNMTMILSKAGYLKESEGRGNFVATNLISNLTVETYFKLVRDYYKVANKKKPATNALVELIGSDDVKKLASDIYKLIKPYL